MRTIITEGQAIDFLDTFFGLNAPVAFEDVKKKYRKESKRLHPDAGGSEEKFKALSGAFDGLKQLYQLGSRLFDADPLGDIADGESRPPPMPRETVDGTPLSELGLGLGPTTNGRDCTDCESRGYTITTEHGVAACKKCEGSGRQPREFPCRACAGSGKFTQKRSRRVVDCRVCQGSGKYKHPFQEEWCHSCRGTGRGSSEKVVRIYAMKCYSCKGTGETEVWNPVLPKGRLSFVGNPTTPEADAPTTKPAPKGNRKVGKDRLFGEQDPDRMQHLLHELAAKGVGGKK